VACGQTTPNIDFACGDGGALCHSSSQYCEVVTTGGGVAHDSGPSSFSVAQCAPLGGCTTCDCLVEAGVSACLGQQSCAQSSSAITFEQFCPE